MAKASRWWNNRIKPRLRMAGEKAELVRPAVSSKQAMQAFPLAPEFQKRFPELAGFILRESGFFPVLEVFRKTVSDEEFKFHPGTRVPIISGNLKEDARLVLYCKKMREYRNKAHEKLQEAAGVWRQNEADKRNFPIEMAKGFEESLNHQKRLARGVLLKGVKRFHAGSKEAAPVAPQRFYPKLKPFVALRWFLNEEAGSMPFLFKLRQSLVEIEHLDEALEKNELKNGAAVRAKERLAELKGAFLYPGNSGIVNLSRANDLQSDKRIAGACVGIFGLRNQIRKKVMQASEAATDEQTEKYLDEAEALESRIDHYKARVRRALMEYQWNISYGPKPGSS